MNITRHINNFIDNEFKITIYNNKIDILNYESISHFDFKKVIVKTKDKNIIINGRNLVVSKLMNDEVLIKGIVNQIELRSQNEEIFSI